MNFLPYIYFVSPHNWSPTSENQVHGPTSPYNCTIYPYFHNKVLWSEPRKNNWHLFIFQIAHHCYKDTQNYNSMFAITCGLNHSAVMRLKNSRQRLPPKYTKLLEELTQVIVPDRNFSRYRNLISNASVSHVIMSLFILWSF